MLWEWIQVLLERSRLDAWLHGCLASCWKALVYTLQNSPMVRLVRTMAWCVCGEHSGLVCLSRDLGIRCKKSDFRVLVLISISKRGEELRLRSTSSMIATLVPI